MSVIREWHRRCVLLDDGHGDDDAADQRHRNETDDDQKCRRLGVIRIAGRFAEEVHHFTESLRDTIDRLVGIVDLRERIPRRDTHTGQIPPTPGLDNRIDPDHEAGEQYRRNDHEVPETEGNGHHLLGHVLRKEDVPAKYEEDEETPGETAGRHDGTHPHHEPREPAHHLGFDPYRAHYSGIPVGDTEIQHPDETDDQNGKTRGFHVRLPPKVLRLVMLLHHVMPHWHNNNL